MLLSSQIQAVRQWVVDAIAACPELDPIPLDRVVWSSQDFPDRGYPYALVFYTGNVELGIDGGQRVDPDTDDLITRTEDNTTISITFVAQRSDTAPTLDQLASSYLREVKARLRSFVAEPIRQAQLAVRAVNAVPDVSRLQGRSQWESRAVLDITFGHAVEVSEQPGIIESVEVTGTTTPSTPSATQTIPG